MNELDDILGITLGDNGSTFHFDIIDSDDMFSSAEAGNFNANKLHSDIEPNGLPGGYCTYYGDISSLKFKNLYNPWPYEASVLMSRKFQGGQLNCFDTANKIILRATGNAKRHVSLRKKLKSDMATFDLYDIEDGVFIEQTINAIAYTRYNLLNGIPVIFGVNNLPYPCDDNGDHSTNHFVVIVGMGNDGRNYFYCWDPACPSSHSYKGNGIIYQGGVAETNKLYLDVNWPGLISADKTWSNHYAAAREPYKVTKVFKHD